MLNVELLKDTLKHIQDNPQTWTQDVWFTHLDPDGVRIWGMQEVTFEEINSCSTAFCFAGHAALKAGFFPPPKNGGQWKVIDPNGHTVYAQDFAQNKLGLTASQADALFHQDNTMEDLEVMVDALIESPHLSGSDLHSLVERYDEDYEEEPCSCCDEDSEPAW
jgi:hypothetical protein